jgi:hypothetical protein
MLSLQMPSVLSKFALISTSAVESSADSWYDKVLGGVHSASKFATQAKSVLSPYSEGRAEACDKMPDTFIWTFCMYGPAAVATAATAATAIVTGTAAAAAVARVEVVQPHEFLHQRCPALQHPLLAALLNTNAHHERRE